MANSGGGGGQRVPALERSNGRLVQLLLGPAGLILDALFLIPRLLKLLHQPRQPGIGGREWNKALAKIAKAKFDGAEKMQERILNDPIMGYIVKEFDVNLVTMDADGKRSVQ